jgi:ATP-binding cassette subfamily F protein 3
VEKLATKIIEVGDGKATLYPGTYEAFLWSKQERANPGATPAGSAKAPSKKAPGPHLRQGAGGQAKPPSPKPTEQSYEDRKRDSAEKKKRERALKTLKDRVAELEKRIAERETAIKAVEGKMAAPDFYSDHEKSKPVLAQHQELMWEVGELLGQWEMLQGELSLYEDLQN